MSPFYINPKVFQLSLQFEEISPDQEQDNSTSMIHSFVNNSNNDVVLDIKITNTPEELEKIQKTIIHQFAPHAGFEIERCEILSKREQPDDDRMETDSFMDSGSQVSHMSTQLKDEIESLIEEKLKKLSLFKEEPKQQQSLFTKKSAPQKISCGDYDHGCVTCDVCQKLIKGCARYKSLIKRDFDICETCEATGVHPEPLIKIRNPIGHIRGMKLNANFEFLSELFSEPTKVQVIQPLCHIRRIDNENTNNFLETMKKINGIENAEKALQTSVNTTSTKMQTEAIPVPKKAPTLCHIRTASKVEKKEEVKEIKKEAMNVEPIVTEVKPKEPENQLLSLMSRMFPHHDTKLIKEFLGKNEGLTLEDIANKFMDLHLN